MMKRVSALLLCALMATSLVGCTVYAQPGGPYGAHWVPGHYGPYGGWHPGHWN